MTVQDFFDRYNNKGIDYDNYYGFQCMDLANEYNRDVVGGPFLVGPNAKDVWDSYPQDKYERIENTPEGVPTKGDIVIWGVGVGPYGHIAVFDHGDVNTFVSFDQNWPINSLCHYQVHNYNGVLGWLRPKMTPNPAPVPVPAPTPPTPNTVAMESVIRAIYQSLTNTQPSPDEIVNRFKQLTLGTSLTDIISQVLNGDSRTIVGQVRAILIGKGWPWQKLSKIRSLIG